MSQTDLPTNGVARARRAVHAMADILAFLAESACVGNGVFWFLTWSALSFDWQLTARVYAGFWTHYVAASPAARHPVEVTVLAALALLTAFAAAIRAPRAVRTWTSRPLTSAPDAEGRTAVRRPAP